MRRPLVVGLTRLAFAGCGGSAKDEQPAQVAEEPSVTVSQPPSGRPLTRPEYFQAVRAIVDGPAGDATAIFNALVARELTPEECAETAREFGRVLDDIVEQVAALVAPAHAPSCTRSSSSRPDRRSRTPSRYSAEWRLESSLAASP
jgi:hypothetical protein